MQRQGTTETLMTPLGAGPELVTQLQDGTRGWLIVRAYAVGLTLELGICQG